MNSGSDAYAQSGVNLNAGDVFSSYAGSMCKGTYSNSQFVHVLDQSNGHFRGPRGLRFVNLPKDFMQVGGSDGIGTATIILSAAGTHRSAASRLVAMTAGDITRFGGLPLILFENLEVKSLGKPGSDLFSHYIEMIDGLGDIAKENSYVVMGGETAEMGVCVSSEIAPPFTESLPVYNWSAFMLGINHPEKLIIGDKIKPGDVIMSLRDGFRSNGASLLRKYLAGKYGDMWWMNVEAKDVLKEIASPAVLYDRFLSELNGWFTPTFRPYIPVHAIAHISGGGIVGKFAKDVILRLGHSAILDNLWEPPAYMVDCANTMNLEDEEIYSVFNGGQGVLAVIDPADETLFCEMAVDFNINVQRAGEIDSKRSDPRVHIHSKFSNQRFTVK